jgi:hypothetical protein
MLCSLCPMEASELVDKSLKIKECRTCIQETLDRQQIILAFRLCADWPTFWEPDVHRQPCVPRGTHVIIWRSLFESSPRSTQTFCLL